MNVKTTKSNFRYVWSFLVCLHPAKRNIFSSSSYTQHFDTTNSKGRNFEDGLQLIDIPNIEKKQIIGPCTSLS